jgi:hypothetical protein
MRYLTLFGLKALWQTLRWNIFAGGTNPAPDTFAVELIECIIFAYIEEFGSVHKDKTNSALLLIRLPQN